MTTTFQELRKQAISRSLFEPVSLHAAVERLGFIQADPIRAPARAQDLILRHRVAGYRAGDLEEQYPALELEEDHFYVYGFLPRPVWQLLHPRKSRDLTDLQRRILDVFEQDGSVHPRRLAEQFGQERAVNAWGGFSRSTQLALDDLHRSGFLRVSHREKGSRVYALASPAAEELPASERMRLLALTAANLLMPMPLQSFRQILNRIRWIMGAKEVSTAALYRELIRDGELAEETVEGEVYVRLAQEQVAEEPAQVVRLLAPFDPVVWDRRRFEHLWGWAYRFEAYTPLAKRTRGYYALPLLWGESMPGWANLSLKQGKLDVDLGFVKGRPADSSFDRALADELERVEAFLQLKP